MLSKKRKEGRIMRKTNTFHLLNLKHYFNSLCVLTTPLLSIAKV